MTNDEGKALHYPLPTLQRSPTFSKVAPNTEPATPLAPMVPVVDQMAREKSGALLPWRGDAENRDVSQQAQLDRLIELERMRQQRTEQAAPPTAIAQSPVKPDVKPVDDKASPILVGLVILAAIAGGAAIAHKGS